MVHGGEYDFEEFYLLLEPAHVHKAPPTESTMVTLGLVAFKQHDIHFYATGLFKLI